MAETEESWLDFVAYPGARRLCAQHVTGNVMHIHWTAYATPDPCPAVIAFYVQRYPGTPMGDTLTISARAGARLSVHAAGSSGYPTLEVGPDAADQTVIIVSRAVGPGIA
jgi:hypothetical protein